MPTLEEIKTWHGREVHGPDGEKIGKIDQIYLDRQTGEPSRAPASTGRTSASRSTRPRPVFTATKVGDAELSRRRSGACTGTSATATSSGTATTPPRRSSALMPATRPARPAPAVPVTKGRAGAPVTR